MINKRRLFQPKRKMQISELLIFKENTQCIDEAMQITKNTVPQKSVFPVISLEN